MTTEDEFQAMLDADPADHGTRLVLADWLREQDDPRADGYQALGRLVLRTDYWSDKRHCWRSPGNTSPDTSSYGKYTLPQDWYDLLPHETKYESVVGTTRRTAEDAAAVCFVLLPPERREELLRGGTT